MCIRDSHTFDDGISVLLAVQEKFGLADLAFGATQFMQIIKDRYDLFGACLLYTSRCV